MSWPIDLSTPGAEDESRQVNHAHIKFALSLCRSQLRDSQGGHCLLVANVDVLQRAQSASALPLSLGRRDCAARRHSARMRRALCPAAAIAVHGEREGEPAVYQHLGSRSGKDFDKLSICNLHRTLVSDQVSAHINADSSAEGGARRTYGWG